ncbi:MAG: DUF1045 domain-containing protein [Lutimaribacter sp.]
MTTYTRYAVYYLPPKGDLADFGAAWLGWDAATGQKAAHFADVAGLAQADGGGVTELRDARADLAAATPAATAPGLGLARLGRFLALVPQGDGADIGRVAAAMVQGLDQFRAPALQGELARRRAAGLTPRQEQLLTQWGYPYVMEAFRFHLTLSGKLASDALDQLEAAAQRLLPPLPQPFVMAEVALLGERADDARFELIERFALA